MSTLLPLGWYGRFWYQKRPAPSRWQCCFPAALELEFGNGAFEPRKMLGKGLHFIQQIAWLKGKFRGWNMVKHDETWVGNGWDWLTGDTLPVALAAITRTLVRFPIPIWPWNILKWWSTHGSAMLILSNRVCWKWKEGKNSFWEFESWSKVKVADKKRHQSMTGTKPHVFSPGQRVRCSVHGC